MQLTDSELSQLAADAAAELGIPGAQVSVLHRGELAQGVTGVANVETSVPITPDTLFQVGSTTKICTAALVMQLVDAGAIGLDVPVVEQLPGFTLSDPAALRALTPRHLLSMSSGIDNGPYTDYGGGDDALARYVEALAELPHVFPPGRGFGYSNASTNVSGRLVEQVTAETWDAALATRLLEPAGLADSTTVLEDLVHRRFAVGHEQDENGAAVLLHSWRQSRSMGPAGGTLCSTASDLVRLAYVFLHGGVSLDGTQVLSPAATAAMQVPEVVVPPVLLADWWGLGPYGKRWGDVEVVGHSGTNIAGSSYVLWAIDLDLAIATTVNLPPQGYPFAARMFKDLFRDLGRVAVPDRPEPTDDVIVDVERLVGRYVMSGLTITISRENGHLMVSTENTIDEWKSAPPSRLRPLTPTTFLPTDGAIDGNRGWALAFVCDDGRRASHLLNGFFALSRVES